MGSQGGWGQGPGRTCRDDGLHAGAVDESPLDGLRPDVGPVHALLAGVVVQHRDVVDVGHREGDDVVVVGGVQVHSPDLHLTCVQQELLKLCGARGGVGSLLRAALPPGFAPPTPHRITVPSPRPFCWLLALSDPEAALPWVTSLR